MLIRHEALTHPHIMFFYSQLSIFTSPLTHGQIETLASLKGYKELNKQKYQQQKYKKTEDLNNVTPGELSDIKTDVQDIKMDLTNLTDLKADNIDDHSN